MPPNELFIGFSWIAYIAILLLINYLVLLPWRTRQYARADTANKSGLYATVVYWLSWVAMLIIALVIMLMWQAVAYGR